MPGLADYRFAIVDIETTGGRANHDRITEIGLIGIENATVSDAWSQLVNPEMPIPGAIQLLTGIHSADVLDKPVFPMIAEELYALLQERILVAHNARFDYSFLRNSFKRLGRSYSPPVLCTVKLSRFLNPERPTHKLDHLIQVYGLYCARRHRAMDDAAVLWDLIKCWIKEHGITRVLQGIESVMKHPALPPNLDPGDIDPIPDLPGVYLFYGKNDALLYVGKSIKLKTRIMSHFSADHAHHKEMRIAQQVCRIEIRRTAGDLGARLLESRLIKKLRPLYNHRLRENRSLVYFLLDKDRQGYLQLKLKNSRQFPEHPCGRIVGLFKSKRAAQAKLREWTDEHGFCQQLTGLEKKSSGPCFAYQLRKCRGACCGGESPAEYNQRLLDVIDDWYLKVWPYNGPRVVEERGEDLTQFHLVDQWCCLDTQSDRERLMIPDAGECRFDLDTYRILSKSLLEPDRSARLRLMEP